MTIPYPKVVLIVNIEINGFGRTGPLALKGAIEKGSKLEFIA